MELIQTKSHPSMTKKKKRIRTKRKGHWVLTWNRVTATSKPEEAITPRFFFFFFFFFGFKLFFQQTCCIRGKQSAVPRTAQLMKQSKGGKSNEETSALVGHCCSYSLLLGLDGLGLLRSGEMRMREKSKRHTKSRV